LFLALFVLCCGWTDAVKPSTYGFLDTTTTAHEKCASGLSLIGSIFTAEKQPVAKGGSWKTRKFMLGKCEKVVFIVWAKDVAGLKLTSGQPAKPQGSAIVVGPLGDAHSANVELPISYEGKYGTLVIRLADQATADWLILLINIFSLPTTDAILFCFDHSDFCKEELEKHTTKEFSTENFLFLDATLNSLLENAQVAYIESLYAQFVVKQATHQINLPSSTTTAIKAAIEAENLVQMRTAFEAARRNIISLLSLDTWPRFVIAASKMLE